MKEELVIKDESFMRKIDDFYVKLVNWIVNMNSDLLTDSRMKVKDIARNTEFLKVRANLIIVGLDLATDIKRNIKSLLLMYQTCGKQPSKSRLHDIVRGIEFLKTIEIEFIKKRYLINQWVILINRYTSEMID